MTQLSNIAGASRRAFQEVPLQIGFRIALGVAGLAVAATLGAQQVKPDRAIKYRQGVMQAQGWHMGRMNAMLKGDIPYNKDEFLMRATYVDQLARMPWEGFTPGSEQGAPTKAKPDIWKDSASFKQHQDKLVAETPKLVAAARTGDASQLKGPFGDVVKACDGCHDDFRSK
jgi:cytochrome c556